MHLTPAGFPSGIPGIGLVIEGAMQQAPQLSRQFMASIQLTSGSPGMAREIDGARCCRSAGREAPVYYSADATRPCRRAPERRDRLLLRLAAAAHRGAYAARRGCHPDKQIGRRCSGPGAPGYCRRAKSIVPAGRGARHRRELDARRQPLDKKSRRSETGQNAAVRNRNGTSAARDDAAGISPRPTACRLPIS